MTKKYILSLLLIVGLALRLYKFDQPPLDWHTFRQVDTLSVSRNIQNKTGTFLIPTYHDLSNLQSGFENPKGYRMVEIPIYNQLAVWSSNLTNIPIEQSSRAISILLSIFSAILLYKTTKNIWTLATFLLLPFNIFYNRTTLPENLAVFFLCANLFFLSKNIIIANIFFSLGLLIKPYIALLLLPLYIFHFINSKKKLQFLLSTTLAFLPFILWRQHITQFPSGIPVYTWLFQQGFGTEKFVAFKPYWFRWLFYERITILISGVVLIFPIVLSLTKKANISYFLGIVLYFVVIARGNVQHDYYQILTIPFLVLIIGDSLNRFNKFFSLILLSLSFFISWQKIKEYYKINNPEFIYAGWITNKILPQKALVIAPNTGDTSLLYQTNRSGWPLEQYDIKTLQKKHNQPIYLVSVNHDNYTLNLKKDYKAIIFEPKLVILDLQQTNP